MSDIARSCARCRRPAVIARGSAAYCLDCNRIMEWSRVIAVVQDADEPTLGRPVAAVARATTASRDAGAVEFNEVGKEPALTGGGGEAIEADPFAQRLV